MGVMMTRLTAKFVREIAKPGRYGDHDGAGLMLEVKPSGSKSYIQRIMVRGRRHDIGLGSVQWTTLSEARAKSQANRKLARTGGDPLAAKRPDIPTFADASETVLKLHAATWRNAEAEASRWRATLREYAAKRIGSKRVDQITSQDVMAILLPIWGTKRATARRVRQRIAAVMKWAVAEGHRQDNPAGDAISAALPKNGAGTKHHTALPHKDVGAALETIRESQAWPCTKRLMRLLVLTAVRSGEARGMRWDEIDWDAAVWTVPAARTKTNRAHRVPLSAEALHVLSEAREAQTHPDLVFPSQRGGVMCANTLNRLLALLDIPAVPHGFRSSFRDWAGDTGHPRELAEAALAHVVGGVEGAYARSDLLERRRALMDAWADYVTVQATA